MYVCMSEGKKKFRKILRTWSHKGKSLPKYQSFIPSVIVLKKRQVSVGKMTLQLSKKLWLDSKNLSKFWFYIFHKIVANILR